MHPVIATSPITHGQWHGRQLQRCRQRLPGSSSTQRSIDDTPRASTPGTSVTIFGTLAPQSFYRDSPVEVGVKFRSDVAGTVTGVRFYKGATDNTTHTGSLWSATGSC
jgi:hypothetical protein